MVALLFKPMFPDTVSHIQLRDAGNTDQAKGDYSSLNTNANQKKYNNG